MPLIDPFLTLYTPTFRRPRALLRCLESVAAQTEIDFIEHLIVVDHVGHGIAGMFAQIADYSEAIHGSYVHLLADDDVLAAPDVVARVRAFAAAHAWPQLILVATEKGGYRWPSGPPWPPRLARIDMSCAIVRRDIWRKHATKFGRRYEGDFDFLLALHVAGVEAAWCDLIFATGAVSRGEPEAVA